MKDRAWPEASIAFIALVNRWKINWLTMTKEEVNRRYHGFAQQHGYEKRDTWLQGFAQQQHAPIVEWLKELVMKTGVDLLKCNSPEGTKVTVWKSVPGLDFWFESMNLHWQHWLKAYGVIVVSTSLSEIVKSPPATRK